MSNTVKVGDKFVVIAHSEAGMIVEITRVSARCAGKIIKLSSKNIYKRALGEIYDWTIPIAIGAVWKRLDDADMLHAHDMYDSLEEILNS